MTCERCGKNSATNVLYCEHCGERRFKAKMRLVNARGNDNTLYIFGQDYLIGRDKSSDIYLDDEAVSRQHARISYDGSTFFIEDLASKNGVLVQDERLAAKRRLNNYDRIQIGAAVLHIYFSEADFPEEKLLTRTGEFVRNTLLKISREIQSKNMVEEVLNTILDGIMMMTQAKEASLWLQREPGEWEMRIGRQVKAVGQGDLKESQVRRLVEKIAEKRSSFIVYDNREQEFLESVHRASRLSYRLLAIPLLSRLRFPAGQENRSVLGVFVTKAPGLGRRLDDQKLGLLESLVSQATAALENSLLYTEALAKRKIDNELEIARKIQARLLPQEIPQVEGTDISCYSRARKYVGGDYYDVLTVRDDSLALVIGDISGKGVGPALLISCLQGSLRAQISYETQAGPIVRNVNHLIRESTDEKIFAALFFGLYEPRSGRLSYVNAGHTPPVIFRRNGTEEVLKATGMALGILEPYNGRELVATLGVGDVLVGYSDGVTEAMSEKMKPLGLAAVKTSIKDFLRRNPEATAQDILNRLLKRVEAHVEKQPQHDDLTVLVLRRTA